MNVYNDELQTMIHSKAKCETSVLKFQILSLKILAVAMAIPVFFNSNFKILPT